MTKTTFPTKEGSLIRSEETKSHCFQGEEEEGLSYRHPLLPGKHRHSRRTSFLFALSFPSLPLPPPNVAYVGKRQLPKSQVLSPLLRNRLGAKKGGKKKNRGGHHERRKSTSTSSSNDSASEKKNRRFLSCPFFFLVCVCHQLRKSRLTMSDRQKSVISILPLLGGGRFPLLLYLRAHP